MKDLDIPNIPDEQRTPLVERLLAYIAKQSEQIAKQSEQIQALRDEIAILKKQKPKPKIRPSKLNDENQEKSSDDDKTPKRRPGSDKNSKKNKLEIHETVIVKPELIPPGSKFNGTRTYDVQDIVIKSHNTRYVLEEWLTPDGRCITGSIPKSGFGHFGSELCSYILYQYYQCHVTEPLLLEQLREFGVDISSGQLSRILSEDKEKFHSEKDEILRVGLEVSQYIHTDDTGARHQGKNGYCTIIGNELFAWFGSTDSKSRINFLKLLQGGNEIYCLNTEAFEYMKEAKLPKKKLEKIKFQGSTNFNACEWSDCLETLGFAQKRHKRIATEAALYAGLVSEGFNRNLVILSDDAGQFNILPLLHALCWIHAERNIRKLVGFTDQQRENLKIILDEFWLLYQSLKEFKKDPNPHLKKSIEDKFDKLFRTKTCFESLNLALKRIYENKKELLLILDRPEIGLHNNPAESDIREYTKRRKVSGGTRSDSGRTCRDTFTSLKKTCRKLGISFWSYLKDRITAGGQLPYLPDLIKQSASELQKASSAA